MCGIVGSYSEQGDGLFLDRLESIRHRGPDDQIAWQNEIKTVQLGHARLAIIDLANGAQPMWDETQRYALIFNGEIYNFRELRTELLGKGFSFQTESDSEVLLNGYIYWGKDVLRKLRGMFAFGIFDKRENSFFLARDHVGIKPLYYEVADKKLLFSSELKALYLGRKQSPRLDLESLHHYLVFGFTPVDRTTLLGINELPPGHYLEFNSKGHRLERFWRWGETQHPTPRNFEVACEEAEEILLQELKEHLVSDVSIGMFLSAGIDSSLLAALLTKKLGVTLEGFTVSFGEKDYDESARAKEIARHLGIPHRIIPMHSSSQLHFSELCERISQFDLPFADSSALPVWEVSAAIRKYHKVVLGGDGGDEIFGGYSRFQNFQRLQKISKYLSPFILKTASKYLSPIRPEFSRQLHKLSLSIPLEWPKSVLPFVAYMQPDEALAWLPTFQRSPDPILQFYASLGKTFSSEDFDLRFRRLTIERSLPGDYLRKVDVMSARHGLEIRVPYLGKRILEFGHSLPSRYLHDSKENKKISRAILSKYLPDQLMPKGKMGFGIPLDNFLSSEHKQQIGELLLGKDSKVVNLLNKVYLDNLLTQFISGKRKANELSRFSLYQRVYMLWSLEIHLRKVGAST